ncbi:MAG: sodium:calcium exchanger, partial [Eudoraea sp.]|nr:sodium:calcium exchanger [Eudoraea sp.]
MSAASAIRFVGVDNGWSNSETIFIDNVQFVAISTPFISIDDVTVNENAGTATFTATHLGLPAGGPFTVNFQTVDGTATAGSDYTAIAGGILSFNGTVGDTEQITVSINDDTIFETIETFSIQLTGTSDPSVDISDTGTGTINDNEVVLGNTPLTLFREFDGYMDYTSTAGTLRTQPNTVDPCAITTSSSNTLSSPIPTGATIEAAYLYWSHSGATMDSQVTFEGNTVDGNVGYTTSISGLSFYGFFSDVTSIVQAIPDPSTNVYDFSGLTVDNTGTYCSWTVVLGGWSLMIFYTDTSLPASTINLYQGFDGNQNSSSTFSLSGFYAIGSAGSKTTALSWEGDQTLANNESLQFTTPLSGTNLLVGDGDNDGISANNPFNSTNFDNTVLPNLNNTASHGVDLDTYDVSAFILPGETSATTQVNVGQDYVIMNAVVLKVPSNLITGRVFEDVNYGGGAGRNYAAASGLGISGATVELWDNGGTLIDTQTTDASGIYVFAGMVNGTYSVRVVNGSVNSTRPGGSGCGSCIPVQTFKTEYIASTLVERTNEVGGANPTATDPGAGTLAGAQSVASVTIVSEGVAGLDFGFNFNAIVNTNIDGQGSLEQFI